MNKKEETFRRRIGSQICQSVFVWCEIFDVRTDTERSVCFAPLFALLSGGDRGGLGVQRTHLVSARQLDDSAGHLAIFFVFLFLLSFKKRQTRCLIQTTKRRSHSRQLEA